MAEYRVRFLMDDNYKVEEKQEIDDRYQVYGDEDKWETVHTGSLADCEAFIRLKEGGYM